MQARQLRSAIVPCRIGFESLSAFSDFIEKERERERERRDTDFACAMMVGCEGLRSERWRVRVRVEIRDGGLEGEG